MGKGSGAVVGYWYGMGMHMVLCHGPVDEIQEIRAGDRRAWAGNKTANETISIVDLALFGGEQKEGGINGDIDLCFGEATQVENEYLKKKIGTPMSAFRGVTALVLKGVYLTANNPYIKPWAVKVKRITKGWHGGAAWYPAKAAVGTQGDMNPAHIIYQCLTDPNWGMGYPADAIDSTSFTAAADALYAEGFGLSFLYNNQSQIGEFVQQVVNHIGGVLYSDPATGKFAIKLIRDDYDPATLPLYDTRNTKELISFQRASWGETVNQVVVIFADRDTGKATSITAENLAAIASQGAVVSQKKQYPGIHDPALAARVAMRDLRSTSSPLSKIKIKVNRQAWQLIPGQVFKFTWPALGLSGVIYRVLQINSGTITDGTIYVEAVEDVFGLPASAYTAQVPASWSDPATLPAPCPDQKIVEATYWDIVRDVAPADRAYFTSVTSFAKTIGRRPSGDSVNYGLQTKAGGGAYAFVGRGDFTPTCTVMGALKKETASSISYDNDVDIELVRVGTYALIDNELVAITAINTTAMTLSFNRGVLDTVPAEHADGARIWFYDRPLCGTDPTEYSTGETVYAKLLPLTGKGELDPASATALSMVMTGRWDKPYTPGQFKIGGAYYPTVISGYAATATWAHRDRTQQTATLIDQPYGNIGPEVGTTYTVTWYNATGASIKTTAGLTGTTDSVTPAAFTNTVRCKVTALRGAASNHQSQDHTFDLAGYGLNYGLYYGMGV